MNIKHTKPSNMLGANRIMLGIIFLMAGVMKIAFKKYGDAWSIQLIEANIPYYSFTISVVPIIEIILGLILLLGYYSRLGAIIVLPIMAVAIYVHFMVLNPNAFPSQPQQPIMPIIIIIMSFVTIVKGGGNYSWDLKHTNFSI